MVRTGIGTLPGYFGLIPMNDVPGFAVRRSYPDNLDLAHVVNREGQAVVTPILQFFVAPKSSPSGVSPVTLRAWVFPRSKETKQFAALEELSAADLDAPTPDSLQRWRRARKPSQVELIGQYVYDAGEDRFFAIDGFEVQPAEMLEDVYQTHLRTLRAGSVWRQRGETLLQFVARVTVFRAQDALLWVVLNCYDVELALARERMSLFHRFRMADFMRARVEPGGERSEFRGFISSRKNLVTNLIVLMVCVWLVYLYGPRTGLLLAIYGSDPLMAATLLLGFFVVDFLGQLALKAAICGLSRLRGHTAFIFQR